MSKWRFDKTGFQNPLGFHANDFTFWIRSFASPEEGDLVAGIPTSQKSTI
jgi:hypothetical protein